MSRERTVEADYFRNMWLGYYSADVVMHNAWLWELGYGGDEYWSWYDNSTPLVYSIGAPILGDPIV